jgi:hypothetical protein
MNPLSIVLASSSLGILVLGVFLKRISDSRSTSMNCFFASACLLFAAYQSLARTKPEWVFMLPFLSSMLFLGRTLGLWWRTKKEPELRPHAQLLTAATSICLVATLSAWFLK